MDCYKIYRLGFSYLHFINDGYTAGPIRSSIENPESCHTSLYYNECVHKNHWERLAAAILYFILKQIM